MTDQSSESEVDNCDNCRFWRGGDDPVELGHCHRHAPPAVTQEKPNEDAREYLGEWPVTVFDDWCGEWEASRSKLPLELPLNNTELSVRAQNVCEGLGIATVGELIEKSGRELYYTRNCGHATVREFADLIRELGGEPPESWLRPARL